MDDDAFASDTPRPEDSSEGVRIIGAEEAQAAIEREDVAHRLPEDAPRFGDRPESPPEGGPRPAIRFPLSSSTDPSEIGRPAVVPVEPRAADMPHWTEPATGEVPRIFASDEPEPAGDDLDAWSSFTSSQPRWRGEATDYERDEYDDFSRLADDDTRIGALDPNPPPQPDDFFELDDPDAGPYYEEPPPARISTGRSRARAATFGGGGGGGGRSLDRAAGAGRDVPTAAAVGVGIAVVFLILAKLGPKALMLLVVAVVAVAAVELFTALRRAGYQPATLVGLAGCALMPIAAYAKGDVAVPLVVALAVVVGLIWYVIGAGGEDAPVLGLSTTLLGICYVGVLGTFGALVLTLPDGIGVLFGAVLATVGYDVGAFFTGQSMGSRPLSPVSPNKSVEGAIGGFVGALVGAVVIAGFITPWSDFGLMDKVLFGLAAGAAATLGDLGESVLKRDMGIKDMGTLLPGHGGVLDRFDSLLFVLPVAYYLARIFLLKSI